MKLYLVCVISMSLCMMYGSDQVRNIAAIITGIGALIITGRWNILFPPQIDADQLLENMLAAPPHFQASFRSREEGAYNE